MPVVLPKKTIEIFSQVTTPEAYKKTVFNILGSLDDVEVMFNHVLVAAYIRPEKTTGGIIRPQDNVSEDVFQGKSGLVLKCGPTAFMDDDVGNKFYGQKIIRGDWCAFFISDAKLLSIKDVPCRLVEDSAIKLKLQDPGVVF